MEASTLDQAAWVEINGQRMFVDPADTRAQRLLQIGGTFNPLSAVMWRRLLAAHRWDLIVDVGSNYGEMLLEIDPAHPATIVAFEANASLLPWLHRTLDAAGRRVSVEPLALSDSEGVVSFNIDETWSGTSSIVAVPDTARGHTIRRVEVRATTLDAYFAAQQAPSACLKIDVEGAEQRVLKGGELFFAQREHCAVMFEMAHLGAPTIRALCRNWRIYFMCRHTHAWVRIDPDMLTETGLAPWFYAQDAVLVSPRSRLRLAPSDAHPRLGAAQACAFDLGVALAALQPSAA